MDARVAQGEIDTRFSRTVFSSVFSHLFRLAATLARPGPAVKFLAVTAIAIVLAQMPANALISPTIPVGATPGSFVVSPSGAATYTIPIVVAPGTNGMQPNLALVYNSQGGNGLLGMGWGLSGLSVIHRCGRTIEIEGIKGGVNYDTNDKFCLDGERLISDSGNQYRTHRESLQKITSTGAATNPSTFTVIDKDGTSREYATAIEAAAPSSSIRRLWVLSKIRDKSGNYLTIAYDKADVAASGDYRPASIAYTGNDTAGISGNNSVEFEYQLRSDVTPIYEGGSVIKILKRLNKITSKAGGGTIVREYRLTYDNDGAVGRSRLIGVEECGTPEGGAVGACIDPTTITWTGESGANFQSATGAQLHPGSFGNINDYAKLTGDFNGDGITDLAVVYSGIEGVWAYSSLGRANGTFQPMSGGQLHAGTFGGVNDYSKLTGDFNGDGITDLGIVYSGASGVWVYTALGHGDGTFQSATGSQLHAGSFGGVNDYSKLTGDFNGDGITDLAIAYSGVEGIWAYTAIESGPPNASVMSAINTGLGVTTFITYRPLTDTTVYTKDTGANKSSYPYVDVQAPMYVVSSVSSTNGIGGTNKTSYRYGGQYLARLSLDRNNRSRGARDDDRVQPDPRSRDRRHGCEERNLQRRHADQVRLERLGERRR